MDLTVEPVLGRAQFLLDPDAPESLNELEGYLIHRAMYDIAREMAVAEGLEYHEFLAKLSNGQKDEIYDRALDRVLPTISKLKGLAERVTGSVAYKIMTRRVHEKLGEKGFLAYLQQKLDADPGDKTLEQLVFFLEVVEFYEKVSKKYGFHREIFSNPVTYGKMVAAISTLREKYYAARDAAAVLKDREEDITKRIHNLRKEKSEARLRREDTAPFDVAIEEAQGELEDLHSNSAEAVEKLEINFAAYTQAAVDVAQSPIDRSLVASSLPKVAEMKLRHMGKDPKEISSEYDKAQDRTKPVAYTIHDNNEVAVVFKVRSRYFKLIQSLFEKTFDVRIGTIEDGRSLLDSFTNPNKRK